MGQVETLAMAATLESSSLAKISTVDSTPATMTSLAA
jgi:hypothetical protein